VFLAVSDNVFINTDYVSSAVIYEAFTEDGDKWFVKLYGMFNIPDIFCEPDGSIVVGGFDTKAAAIKFIEDAEVDVVCEVEANDDA